MRSYFALLLALIASGLALPELRQGGTQGWELRSVTLSELNKLGLATGPSNRRPIFHPPGPSHGGFQQIRILNGGPPQGHRGQRSFPGANIPLENLFGGAQIHRGSSGGPQIEGPINHRGSLNHGGGIPQLNNLRLPPGWQAIQIDANQFRSIASGKAINIPGLGSGPVHIANQFNPPSPPPPPAALQELPNNKLELPQGAPSFQHGPYRFAHVSEEVQLIGQNGQKTIEVPIGTGHDHVKQVVQQQAEPQGSPVPAAEGGINIPGGLPAAIQQFLKENTPQFQVQDEEEKQAVEQQAAGQSGQIQQQQPQQLASPQHHFQQPQHQVVQHHEQPQQQQHQSQQQQQPIHFQQQQVHPQLQQHIQHVPQIQQPQIVHSVAPQAESPIPNIPPGWKVIRVTAEQLAAYQRGEPAPWLNQQPQQHLQQQQQQPQQQQGHEHHQQEVNQIIQAQHGAQSHQQVQHIREHRSQFQQGASSGNHNYQGQSESYQTAPVQAPPVRIPPRANVKVVYLPFNNVKNEQHQQPLYREERRELPRHQQEWQTPNMDHSSWKAITPGSFTQPTNAPWKHQQQQQQQQQSESSNGGAPFATSERYHQRGNHIEEHRHEHPPSSSSSHNQEGQRARGVVTRENAGKWF